ncbi:MAG: twin-arginine translocation signal domain-containing protein, partial [Gemmatimonadales bacterium]
MACRNQSREAFMDQDRREFLKTTSVAGAAAMTGAAGLTTTPVQAQIQMPTQAMARGLTLATLRRADGS